MLDVRTELRKSPITHFSLGLRLRTSSFSPIPTPKPGCRRDRSEGPPLPSQTGLQPRGETPDRRCGVGALGQGTPKNERVPKVRPGLFDPVEDGEGVWGKKCINEFQHVRWSFPTPLLPKMAPFRRVPDPGKESPAGCRLPTPVYRKLQRHFLLPRPALQHTRGGTVRRRNR